MPMQQRLHGQEDTMARLLNKSSKLHAVGVVSQVITKKDASQKTQPTSPDFHQEMGGTLLMENHQKIGEIESVAEIFCEPCMKANAKKFPSPKSTNPPSTTVL
jgi:hypothetical protein